MANQNVTQLTQQSGSAAPTSLFYAVTGGATDTGLPLSVLFNNPQFTGVPTSPTAAVDTSTTQIASTAYVVNQSYLKSTTASTTYAPIASPTFTGTVVIPTVTLSGGTINGTSVGATTPSTGAFTTINSTALATLNSVSTSSATISGGSINGTSVGATVTSTGSFTTLAASGLITPSTTAGIKGTVAADSANAGSVGEYIQSTVVSGSAISLTSGTPVNVTSISLTAGDWDVFGAINYTVGATTAVQLITGSASQTSATLLGGSLFADGGVSAGITTILGNSIPTVRVNVSTTTTVFLVTQANFTVSTLTAYGFIAGRRRR